MKQIIRIICFITAAVCFGMGIDFIISGLYDYTAYAIVAGGLCLIGSYFCKKQRYLSFAQELHNVEGANAQLLKQRYGKAVDDFSYLNEAMKNTNDPALKANLIQLQEISSKMIGYLERNPQQIASADKFINYYQESTVNLVKQYIELEKTGLDSTSCQKAKTDVIDTLNSFQQAYKECFDKMIADQLMNMNAEMSVAKIALKEDGIDEKHTSENNSDNINNQNIFDKDNFSNGKKETVIDHVTGIIDDNFHTNYKRTFNTPVDDSFKGKTLNFIDNVTEWGIFYFDKDYPVQDVNKMKKYRLLTGISSCFFGGLGVPYFLLGKPIKGTICLLFFWTHLPAIWGIYKGFRYLMMDNNEFYIRYYLPKFTPTSFFNIYWKR